ncbi:MAG: hypothetical protein Q8N18_11790 [Opitutaceae bacterium]|nr:hypothetical protein [Opitutaceae bacterium]
MPSDPAPSHGRKRVVLTAKEAAEGFGRTLAENTNNLLADGKLDAREAVALKQWLEACGESDLPALNYLREEVQRYAADGEILPWELGRLQLALERILPPADRAIAKAARNKAEAQMEASEATESEASRETRRQDFERRRAPATDDSATMAQVKFIEDLGGTIPTGTTKHQASELIGRLLAEREEVAGNSNSTSPPSSKKAGDTKLMKATNAHKIKPGQTVFDVSLPARQPYEGKATLKQKDLIWSLGFKDQAVIDSLGKWQASALIDQMKSQRKPGSGPALILLIFIVIAVALVAKFS